MNACGWVCTAWVGVGLGKGDDGHQILDCEMMQEGNTFTRDKRSLRRVQHRHDDNNVVPVVPVVVLCVVVDA